MFNQHLKGNRPNQHVIEHFFYVPKCFRIHMKTAVSPLFKYTWCAHEIVPWRAYRSFRSQPACSWVRASHAVLKELPKICNQSNPIQDSDLFLKNATVPICVLPFTRSRSATGTSFSSLTVRMFIFSAYIPRAIFMDWFPCFPTLLILWTCMHCLFSLSFFSSSMHLWLRRVPGRDVHQRPWSSLKASILMPNVLPLGYPPFPLSGGGLGLKLIVRLANLVHPATVF